MCDRNASHNEDTGCVSSYGVCPSLEFHHPWLQWLPFWLPVSVKSREPPLRFAPSMENRTRQLKLRYKEYNSSVKKISGIVMTGKEWKKQETIWYIISRNTKGNTFKPRGMADCHPCFQICPGHSKFDTSKRRPNCESSGNALVSYWCLCSSKFQSMTSRTFYKWK